MNFNNIEIGHEEADRIYRETMDRVYDISQIKSFSYWNNKRIEEKIKSEALEPLSFGLKELDEKIKLCGKRLLFIVARSSYGKTSFAAMMMKTQIKKNKTVLMFSCEEAGEDFISRMNPLFNNITDEQKGNFYMVDNPSLKMSELTRMCLGMKLKVGLDCVYIDQLNKLYTDKPYKNKHERIVLIAEELQALVKILECPVIVLHQANRSVEGKKDLMSQGSVSDADAVYNESQIIFFIESPDFWEWSRNKDSNQIIFDYIINVDKNRTIGGWRGKIECKFDTETGMFIDNNLFELYKKVKDHAQANKPKEIELLPTEQNKEIDNLTKINKNGYSEAPPF